MWWKVPSSFQSLFYNLKAFSSRIAQRPLATETAREGGETEYRGFFSTAVSTTMTWVDLPRQPIYPSLDFYSHLFGAYKDWSVETLSGGLVQSFISNSVCKNREFLTSLCWEQGVQTRPRQQRGPGKFLPMCTTMEKAQSFPLTSQVVHMEKNQVLIVIYHSCQNIWPIKSGIPAVNHSRNFMYLFLI